MPDYVLTSPEGQTIVTGNGSERARLLGAGWSETTKTLKKPEPKPEPAKPDAAPKQNPPTK